MKENLRVFYPAKFYKEENGYTVEFLDFPNAVTCGETLEEAYFMAQDILCMIIEDTKLLPKPTLNFKNIELKEEEFITLVDLDIEEHNKKISNQVVSTTVTMPEWLKTLAEKNVVNLSQTLQNALKEKLITKKLKYID